ncbi:DUF3085 domain-containing protein (plasmid) [Xenorhabdus stockiae]|uniref:DUF3085 domain-containing protein n=1 Tax=Xenorhabdus stockiae TaxID=351614 RepID=UPI003CF02026
MIFDIQTDPNVQRIPSVSAYAEGLNPYINPHWYNDARAECGGDHFTEYLDYNEELFKRICRDKLDLEFIMTASAVIMNAVKREG